MLFSFIFPALFFSRFSSLFSLVMFAIFIFLHISIFRIANKSANYAVNVGTVQNDCYYFPGASPFGKGIIFSLQQFLTFCRLSFHSLHLPRFPPLSIPLNRSPSPFLIPHLLLIFLSLLFFYRCQRNIQFESGMELEQISYVCN